MEEHDPHALWAIFPPQSNLISLITAGKVQPARVEFAAPEFAVLESDKIVKIGVKRSGNTKITASVK